VKNEEENEPFTNHSNNKADEDVEYKPGQGLA